MSGTRPAPQVIRWTSPEVYSAVARRSAMAARRRRRGTGRRPPARRRGPAGGRAPGAACASRPTGSSRRVPWSWTPGGCAPWPCGWSASTGGGWSPSCRSADGRSPGARPAAEDAAGPAPDGVRSGPALRQARGRQRRRLLFLLPPRGSRAPLPRRAGLGVGLAVDLVAARRPSRRRWARSSAAGPAPAASQALGPDRLGRLDPSTGTCVLHGRVGASTSTSTLNR